MLRSLNNYPALSLLFFIYKSFGEVVFKFSYLTSVVQRYVSSDKDPESAAPDSAAKDDVKMFAAESESVIFLNSSLKLSENEQFKEFHDFALECQQPIGTIFCSSYDNCRNCKKALAIDHFTVVGLVTWPLNGSEAGVELVLIQTSLFLLCKSSCSYAN